MNFKATAAMQAAFRNDAHDPLFWIIIIGATTLYVAVVAYYLRHLFSR